MIEKNVYNATATARENRKKKKSRGEIWALNTTFKWN